MFPSSRRANRFAACSVLRNTYELVRYTGTARDRVAGSGCCPPCKQIVSNFMRHRIAHVWGGRKPTSADNVTGSLFSGALPSAIAYPAAPGRPRPSFTTLIFLPPIFLPLEATWGQARNSEPVKIRSSDLRYRNQCNIGCRIDAPGDGRAPNRDCFVQRTGRSAAIFYHLIFLPSIFLPLTFSPLFQFFDYHRKTSARRSRNQTLEA